jgi:hypothetical protein
MLVSTTGDKLTLSVIPNRRIFRFDSITVVYIDHPAVANLITPKPIPVGPRSMAIAN